MFLLAAIFGTMAADELQNKKPWALIINESLKMWSDAYNLGI